ncbi:MAG: glycosyltransferase family 2 protein [Lachnospiraceae bacterium]|nr:glycosyltransferase family 2 protein [Lachnospiraceae bacterium]
MKTVSVIIPVYNNEHYVEKCLRSVMEQTYPALEILAIDDGSSDRSGEILERLADEDSRIVLIRQENRGVGAARNAGLDRATGTYLTFVDGDDYISPNYIRRYVRRIEQTKADMIVGGLDFVTPEGKCVSRLTPDVYISTGREEWTMRVSGVWAHFYKRVIWEMPKIRFAETKERGEDMPIALYFAACAPKIDVLSASGYYYVQHPSSAMHNFRGLRTYQLPYETLRKAIRTIRQQGIRHGKDFHELFVLRILATCCFDLARGADKDKKKELHAFIYEILETWYPNYADNPYARLTTHANFPFAQRAAVWLLVKLAKHHMLWLVP